MSKLMFACFSLAAGWGLVREAAAQATATPNTNPPTIVSIAKPVAGDTTIWFRGGTGPFTIQMRNTLDASAAWFDLPGAKVTELQPGVYMGLIPNSKDDLQFYRVVSQAETITDLKGWTILAQVSAPANRQNFVAGENPVVTVSILDTFAQGITRTSFSTFNLYLYGPQDPTKTVTAVKLLNASTDRTKTPHHYIDLRSNPAVQVSGSQLTYPLQAVTTEAPGTYRLAVYAVLAADPFQQIMKFADLQIGTSVAEPELVSRDSCAACHLGPASGKLYMHHVFPGRSPAGSWSLDYAPVTSCKACHNNDGYAAYNDSSVAGGKVPDTTVRRVHGVHMGAELALDFNTNSVNGDFRDYVHVEFPADIRNCGTCHQDDRWKTVATRQACGSCHDNVWFGAKASMPATNWVYHAGLTQADDSKCALCHDATGIADNHAVAAPAFRLQVSLAMSPPANAKYYVAGEAPQVTVKVKDAATGAAINPTNMVDPLISTNVAATEWKRGNLFVSGPRSHTVPVLTTAAANTNWTSSTRNNELRYMRDATKRDPRVTRTDDAIIYQLGDVAQLAPGTYTVYADIQNSVTPPAAYGGSALLNFQVGTTNVESLMAGNCIDCHGDTRMHTTSRAATFTPDLCKSCHDYEHQLTGKTNWLNSQFGFGAAPLSRRVHGIHYGNQVSKPKEIQSADFSHVIFPMDVRNCTKCHSQSTSWTEKPTRLACLACHDDDAALAHGKLMTYDPTPNDPWNGDEQETCAVCHGSKADFSPSKAHALSNPYVPPYPREPQP